MTIPSERTRALRWGGEFLNELLVVDNIGADLKAEVAAILVHYPSEGQIRDWAASWPEDSYRPWLAPEDEPIDERANPTISSADQVPDPLNTPITTPTDRARALRLAGELFVRIRTGHNLNAEQKRSIQFILRHYPGEADIEFYGLI